MLTINKEYIKPTSLSKQEIVGEKRSNPYGFTFDEVNEYDIIKGSIKSDIPVFLHGQSSDGKSARIKQLDPNCEIVYMRNATPESLVGKSVYDPNSKELIDIKPSWLVKLEKKCEEEPRRLHILFFDEISNALPSVQGMAFNIILDREVNGKWQLPINARIVAAGNELKDSLAANRIAEPLFNRFAHVYIKTELNDWLKWAIKNSIHPLICSYMAYTQGEALRTEYTGETPNADPRKWEMASKMLYSTNKPDMLRSLIGEDLTNSFIDFCKERPLNLEDIDLLLHDKRYDYFFDMDRKKKYATACGLSNVDEEYIEKVRIAMRKMGKEVSSYFDMLWAGNNQKKKVTIVKASKDKSSFTKEELITDEIYETLDIINKRINQKNPIPKSLTRKVKRLVNELGKADPEIIKKTNEVICRIYN